MGVTTSQAILATAWISEEDEENYWLEGGPVELAIERNDTGEIRIGVHRDLSMSEDAGLYLSDTEAMRLMAAIGAAICRE